MPAWLIPICVEKVKETYGPLLEDIFGDLFQTLIRKFRTSRNNKERRKIMKLPDWLVELALTVREVNPKFWDKIDEWVG